MFIDAWKIINVHKLGDDKRLREPLRSVINSTADLRLQQILSLSHSLQHILSLSLSLSVKIWIAIMEKIELKH